MSKQAALAVNDNPVPLDHFTQAFINHTVAGMTRALEGTAPIKTISLTVDGNRVVIDLNGKRIATNDFVNKIVSSTVAGMVSSLKGASGAKKKQVYIS